MRLTEPINGKCPRCQVELRHVPTEYYPNGRVDTQGFYECPQCDWQPGEWDRVEEIVACDECGVVTTHLVKTPEGDVCTFCATKAADHEYIVSTLDGRNISYHATSPKLAREYAERRGHQVRKVWTIEQYESRRGIAL